MLTLSGNIYRLYIINPIKLTKESYSHLLDAAPYIEFRNQIRQIAKQVAESYLLVENIKTTQSRRFMFIDMYLDLHELIETKKYLCLSHNYISKLQNYFSQNKVQGLC
nr:hypothetical protein [Francisella persica]